MKIVDERASATQVAIGDVKPGQVVEIEDYAGLWVRGKYTDRDNARLFSLEDGEQTDYHKRKQVTLVNATVTITDA